MSISPDRKATRPLRALIALALAVTLGGLAPGAASATVPDPGGSETTAAALPPPDGRYFGFSQGPLDSTNALHAPSDYAP